MNTRGELKGLVIHVCNADGCFPVELSVIDTLDDECFATDMANNEAYVCQETFNAIINDEIDCLYDCINNQGSRLSIQVDERDIYND